ncbi:lipoate--protein ligase family protein, partial [Limosilactobacillus fermentum]|nr:lipoate--protein ligase family protein [Limosilactobacillus fermentum]
ALVGVEYSAEAIKAALSKVDIEQNLSAVSVDELTALLMRVL